MRSGDERLWDIVTKAGIGASLSSEELGYAEAALRSPLALDRSNACEALLRRSTSDTQRAAAFEALEALCLASADEDYVVILLNAMLYTRNFAFRSPSRIRDFLVRSGRSRNGHIRTNAVELIEPIARGGDREALDLIKGLARDENANVRSNALLSLRNLGVSP
jgi:HEAT repeat protein